VLLELVEKKGIEVGNIFQLGLHYTNLMKGAVYKDEKGESVPYYMGCYGIGIGRTMATIVEKYNDLKGIMWPELVAPFKIHLLSLKGAEKEAEEIYHTLLSEKIEVLYDDRDLSAGAKFADSDLIGIPYRIVVSSKTLEKESVEVKKRALSETQLIKINELISFLQ
jgi:prolyl-tRNA synthetase